MDHPKKNFKYYVKDHLGNILSGRDLADMTNRPYSTINKWLKRDLVRTLSEVVERDKTSRLDSSHKILDTYYGKMTRKQAVEMVNKKFPHRPINEAILMGRVKTHTEKSIILFFPNGVSKNFKKMEKQLKDEGLKIEDLEDDFSEMVSNQSPIDTRSIRERYCFRKGSHGKEKCKYYMKRLDAVVFHEEKPEQCKEDKTCYTKD